MSYCNNYIFSFSKEEVDDPYELMAEADKVITF